MTERATIAYLSATASIAGGAEVSLINLIRGLDRSRFRPVMAVPGPGKLADRVGNLGIEPEIIPMETRRRRHPFAFRRSQAAISRWLKREGAGILHANSFWAPELAIPAAVRSGVPAIYHVRDFYERLDPARASAFRSCSCVLAISRCVRDNVLALLPGLPVEVVYNAVDTAAIEAAAPDESLRAEAGWQDAFVIGTASRISPEKGQMDFLKAASAVAREHPAARFVVMGNSRFALRPDFAARVEEECASLGLTGKVRFTGFVDDVAAVYKTMDVCVLASLREPFGRVVIEAMACGVPVVATRSGGPEEIIEHGKDGLLVDAGDPEAMAAACLRIAGDSSLRDSLGAAGRQSAVSRFSLENARQVERIYDMILRGEPFAGEAG